jgi:hydrogenase maturation protease
MSAPHPVVVFACGEPLRGDDGVGAAAVRGLEPAVTRRAVIHSIRSLDPEDLVELDPDSYVVIVDAVVGVPPGTLVHIDLAQLGAQTGNFTPTSTHQLPLPDVTGLAELLGWAPRGMFLGVGAASVAPGDVLSPAVAAALPGLCAAIRDAVISVDM